MKRFSVIIVGLSLIIILSVALSSCSIFFPRIEGIVYDATTGQGIKGVKINLVHSKLYTATDRNGVFWIYIFTIKKINYADIVVSKPGYETKILRIYFGKDRTVRVNIGLNRSTSI